MTTLPPPIEVDLTDSDQQLACIVGAMTMVNVMHGKRKGRYGADPNDIWLDVKGALGELAVAKALNLGWFEHTVVGRVDVGDYVQVRAVDQSHHRLIVHDDDKGHEPFVLADVTKLPRVQLVGWLYASEAQVEDNVEDPTFQNRPAHFVERHELTGCQRLCRWVHQDIVDNVKAWEARNGHKD